MDALSCVTFEASDGYLLCVVCMGVVTEVTEKYASFIDFLQTNVHVEQLMYVCSHQLLLISVQRRIQGVPGGRPWRA